MVNVFFIRMWKLFQTSNKWAGVVSVSRTSPTSLELSDGASGHLHFALTGADVKHVTSS